MAESKAVERLSEIREEFAAEIRLSYEHKAKPCSACETPGVCCRDEHFVNVRITRLEAVAIRKKLAEMEPKWQEAVYSRARAAVEKYELAAPGDIALKTFACPLFEKGVGCLVHETAKPLPCIAHACYESRADLPPAELLERREDDLADLNRRVYGRPSLPVPLPVAVLGERDR